MHAVFWWANLRDRDHFEDPRADWITLKCIFKKKKRKKKRGGIAGSRQELEVLWTRLRTFGFQKILGTFSLGQHILVSQRSLRFRERLASSPNNALEYEGTKNRPTRPEPLDTASPPGPES